MGDLHGGTGAPETPLREQVLHAFARFGPAWVRFLHATLGAETVSPSGVRLLSALRRYEHPPIMRELVNDLGASARAVTGLVDTLEHEGLVRREPHPGDRRATRIVLTERGKRVSDQLWSDHLGAASSLFEVLSPHDQATLVRILGVLADELAARGQRVAPDCVVPDVVPGTARAARGEAEDSSGSAPAPPASTPG